MNKFLLILAILPFCISCGNGETTDTEASTKMETSMVKDTEKSPCELVSEATIEKILSIPLDTPTEVNNAMRTYPTCFYTWETVQFSETKKIGNKDMSIDFPTEVTIVLVKNATKSMFQTSVKVYKDRQTQNDVGEMAVWGDQMSQLSFLTKGYMIHLYVKMSSDATENKNKALKISEEIIENL